MAEAPKKPKAGRRMLNAVASFLKGPPKLYAVHPDLARLLVDYSAEAALLKFMLLKATKLTLDATVSNYDSRDVWTFPRDKESEAHDVLSMYYDKTWQSKVFSDLSWETTVRLKDIRPKYFIARSHVLQSFDRLITTVPEKILKKCVYGRPGWDHTERWFAVPKQEELDCFAYCLFYKWTRRARKETFKVKTLTGDELTIEWPEPSFRRRPDLHAVVRSAAKQLRADPSTPHRIETHDFDLVTESGTPVNEDHFFALFEQYLKDMKINLLHFMLNKSWTKLPDLLYHADRVGARIVVDYKPGHSGSLVLSANDDEKLPAVVYRVDATYRNIRAGDLVHSINGKSTIGASDWDLRDMKTESKKETRMVVTSPDWYKSIGTGCTPVDVTFFVRYRPPLTRRDAFVHIVL